MNSYFLTFQAAQDLDEIHDFIALESPSAALQLIAFLEEKCQVIAQTPNIGRRREELASALRSFPVGNYVIFYRRIENDVQVIRILHGARDIEAVFEEG